MTPVMLAVVVQKPALAVSVGMATWIVALWALLRRSARPARPDVYFGVTVPPDWPDSPAGRAVAGAYRRWTDVAALVALPLAFVAVAQPLRSPLHLLTFAGLLLQVVVGTAAYLRGRRATLPFAAAAPLVREASLEPDRSPTAGRWLLASFGPMVLVALSAAVLAWRYPHLPDPMPLHYNAAGHVDRWGPRTPGTVFAVPLVAAMTSAFIAVTGAVTVHSGRRLRDAGRDDRYLRGVLWVLLAADYFATVALLAVGFLPAAAGTRWAWLPWWVAIGTTPAMALAMGYFALRVWPTLRTNSTVTVGDGTPDRCWRLGLFYVNPADPAVLVPKRFGFGYTVNFARPGTWALIAGSVAYVLAISVLVPMLVGRR